MAIEFAWDVKKVEVYPNLDGNEDVIHRVHWRLTATDTENLNELGTRNIMEQEIGIVDFNTSNITNFISLDSLDSATVESWVESSIGSEQLQDFKDNLENRINKQVNPTSVYKKLSF